MTSILKFIVLTFGISWTVWLAASTSAPKYAPILFLPGTIAPAYVALWLTFRESGRSATVDLLRRVIRWRVSIWFFVFAISYMAVIKLTAALLQRLAIGTWPAFGGPIILMVIGVLISTPVQAGEEIGWRGYILPRLAKVTGYGPASLIVGVIWALWHVPMFYIAGGDMVGQSFPMFALAVTPLAAALGWLYVRTGGSLLLPMLMHAAVNNTTGIVPSAVAAASNRVLSFDASNVAIFTVVLLWFGAAYFLRDIWRIRAIPSTNA